MDLPTSEEWAASCAADGEFNLAARFWSGGLTLQVGEEALSLQLVDGAVSAGPSASAAGVIKLAGNAAVWEKLFAATPPRFHNDVMANMTAGLGIAREGDPVVCAQYYAAVARALELLRPGHADGPELPDRQPAGGSAVRFDGPVGRYVHLDLCGHDHRIYFEEAGQGIPLLLQHTAGCHSSQWRHLFEHPEITRHFRLIAYDLPYHGKSLPPETKRWWSEGYQLEGEFLRSVPVKLSAALELDSPVFMGCSVGGLLALDLAHRHPELFRAVISVEGALKIDADADTLSELWHPQVSNEYKARLMEGLMSPTSPVAYRKETGFVYAGGWPPVFLGDLHYYVNDFDLRQSAAAIDTDRVGVHILSGEYDWSGTAELGREAHRAIKGSTWSEMKGVGHFPMSENPAAFIAHLLPVLEAIRSREMSPA